jgi:hypothetical protein
MPFRNVEYLDDLVTWAEAEGLTDDDDNGQSDNDTEDAWDGPGDGEVTT